MAAALPSTIDFLNEGGQVLKALPPPLFEEEKLREHEEKARHDNATGCGKHTAHGMEPGQLCKAETVLSVHEHTNQAISAFFAWETISVLAEGA